MVGYHLIHLVLILRRSHSLTLGHLNPLEPAMIALRVICSGLNLRLGVWVISRLTVVFAVFCSEVYSSVFSGLPPFVRKTKMLNSISIQIWTPNCLINPVGDLALFFLSDSSYYM